NGFRTLASLLSVTADKSKWRRVAASPRTAVLGQGAPCVSVVAAKVSVQYY
ncbi:hypothetical protein J6590_025189, partial [Homalodisca vitripennis]